MTTAGFDLAAEIKRVAAEIQASKVSNTKWGPIEDLIAEATHVAEDDVYAATVSKPGNLSVRMNQSDLALDADVFVAMYTGADDEMERCVTSAVKRCRKQNRRFVLILADQGKGMELVVVVKQPTEGVPSELAAAYPAASVLDV